MSCDAYNVPLNWIYHRHLNLTLWLSYRMTLQCHYCPFLSLLHPFLTQHVIICWSDTDTFRQTCTSIPVELFRSWHRFSDQFIQNADHMLLTFEKMEATQRKLKAWGIASVATWHTSFTLLSWHRTVLGERKTIWFHGSIHKLSDILRNGAGGWLIIKHIHENNRHDLTTHTLNRENHINVTRILLFTAQKKWNPGEHNKHLEVIVCRNNPFF